MQIPSVQTILKGMDPDRTPANRMDAAPNPKTYRVKSVTFPAAHALTYRRILWAAFQRMQGILDEWIDGELANQLKALEQEEKPIGDELDAKIRRIMQIIFDDVADYRTDDMTGLETATESLMKRLQEALALEAFTQEIYQVSHAIMERAQREFVRHVSSINTGTGAAFGVVAPLRGSALLTRRVDFWVQRQIDLIKSVPRELHGNVKRVVWKGVQEGKGLSAITEEIHTEARGTISYSRANLIARDQCGTMSAGIAREQMKSAGCYTYIWRNSQDERVRGNPTGRYPKAKPSHWAEREGKVFALVPQDQIPREVKEGLAAAGMEIQPEPIDGHAGFAIACRCSQGINETELSLRAGWPPERAPKPTKGEGTATPTKTPVQTPRKPRTTKPKPTPPPEPVAPIIPEPVIPAAPAPTPVTPKPKVTTTKPKAPAKGAPKEAPWDGAEPRVRRTNWDDIEFVEAKNRKAAAKWIIDNDLADAVDFGTLPMDVINRVNHRLLDAYARNPELRVNMKFFGSVNGRINAGKKYVVQEFEGRISESLRESLYDSLEMRERRKLAAKLVNEQIEAEVKRISADPSYSYSQWVQSKAEDALKSRLWEGRNAYSQLEWIAKNDDKIIAAAKKKLPKLIEKEALKGHSRLTKKPKPGVVAQSTPREYGGNTIGGRLQGVTFNEGQFKQAAYQTGGKFDMDKWETAMKQWVQLKESPIGCNTIESVLDHEIGHMLDDFIRANTAMRHAVSEYGRKWISQVEFGTPERVAEITHDIAKEHLSRYSMRRYQFEPNRVPEVTAEAWSEYLNNPSPRRVAQEVGKYIEEMMQNIRTYGPQYNPMVHGNYPGPWS